METVSSNLFIKKLLRETVTPKKESYDFCLVEKVLFSKKPIELIVYPMRSIYTLPKFTFENKDGRYIHIPMTEEPKLILHVSKHWLTTLTEKEMVGFALLKLEGRFRAKHK